MEGSHSALIAVLKQGIHYHVQKEGTMPFCQACAGTIRGLGVLRGRHTHSAAGGPLAWDGLGQLTLFSVPDTGLGCENIQGDGEPSLLSW